MPIANHSYDPDTRVYTVQFKEGGMIYHYQNVEPEKATDVQQAEPADLGKTIQATLVRGGYEFDKVRPEDTPDGEGSELP